MTAYTNTTMVNGYENIISRFLSGEGSLVASYGRLSTYETDDGSVLLLSYTNEVLAEVDGSDVTLFTGHYGQVSKTTTEHIATLGSVLSHTDGKDVTVTDSAPTMGVGARASESAQYISNYVGDYTDSFSPVEIDAVEDVRDALRERVSQLFGE